MKLVPVVILVEEDDLNTIYAPFVAAAAARFDADLRQQDPERRQRTAVTMSLNGWTPEMFAWSGLLHSIAGAVRAGAMELAVQAPGDG